jgi:hypothetical protein
VFILQCAVISTVNCVIGLESSATKFVARSILSLIGIVDTRGLWINDMSSEVYLHIICEFECIIDVSVN